MGKITRNELEKQNKALMQECERRKAHTDKLVCALETILDTWHITDNCQCPHENEKYHVFIDRSGKKFYDLIEVDIIHEPDCPYTQIATLIGHSNLRHWQDEGLIGKPPITDLRDK